MSNFSTSQLAKITLIILLFLTTPFISASMRPSYLYFVLNILIIVLGIESGFLTAVSLPHSSDDKKPSATATTPPPSPPVAQEPVLPLHEISTSNGISSNEEAAAKEKIADQVSKVRRLKRCPSMPSLFFICSGDDDELKDQEEEEKDQEVPGGELSAQELFAKTEMFIGNFYKQLKMQREESWKKINGLYHRAF